MIAEHSILIHNGSDQMPYSTENNFVNYCARCSINYAIEITARAAADNNYQSFGIYRNSLKMPTPEQISKRTPRDKFISSLLFFLKDSSYILMLSHIHTHLIHRVGCTLKLQKQIIDVVYYSKLSLVCHCIINVSHYLGL